MLKTKGKPLFRMKRIAYKERSLGRIGIQRGIGKEKKKVILVFGEKISLKKGMNLGIKHQGVALTRKSAT